jgi:hypothetical protein
MKSTSRVKTSGRAKPVEQEFSDFEAMVPTEGIRRTRKPAKSTIASADTEGQKSAATRARKTAKSTGSRERRNTPRTPEHKVQTVTQGHKKAPSARSRSPRSR